MKKYFKPKSMTWWAGVLAMVKALSVLALENRFDVETFVTAAGLIGIRGAIK